MSRLAVTVLPIIAWHVLLLSTSGANRLPLLLTAADANPLRTNGPLDKLCELCTNVTEKAHSVLTDPAVAENITAAVESHVCSLLPGDAAAKCNATVEDHVPEILALLDDAVSYENVCRKTHICDTKQDEDIEECLTCHLVVKILRSKLLDSDAQERLTQLLLNRCAALRNEVLVAKCSQTVQSILPVVFQKVSSLLDATTLCQKLKLCAAASSYLPALSTHTSGRTVSF